MEEQVCDDAQLLKCRYTNSALGFLRIMLVPDSVIISVTPSQLNLSVVS